MFLPRDTIVVPVGLVTQPNQYGQYPKGALRVARNYVMRNPGELVQAPDTFNPVTWTTEANYILQKLFPLDQSHVYTFQTQSGGFGSIRESGNPTLLPLSIAGGGFGHSGLLSLTGRIPVVRSRERIVIGTGYGFLVGDFMAPTSLAERTLREAGMPQPAHARFGGIVSTNAGALPDQTIVAYQACWVRKFSDGYAVRSAPSPIFNVANTFGGPRNFIYRVAIAQGANIQAGDILEIYRTDGQPASSTYGGYAAAPGATVKLVNSYTVSQAEINAGSVSVTDTMSFVFGTTTTQGEELYTNPFQEGPTFANRQPPLAKCVANFKGYTFYGCTTERPQFKFSSIGGFGDEAVAIAQGVPASYFKAYALGAHRFAGTATNGNNVITGVSAADFVGLAIGQKLSTAAFSGGFALITALNPGGGTVSLSKNAVTTLATTWTANDVLELNGIPYYYAELSSLVLSLGSDFLGGLNTQNTSASWGIWEVNVDVPLPYAFGQLYIANATISIEPLRFAVKSNPTAPITVRASNGGRFSPAIPDMTQTAQSIASVTRKNRMVWSKQQQPEHAPDALEEFVGNGEIIALNQTRDALWIWCTDGLNRLSGDGGADGLGFRVDLVDTTLILAAPQASTVLDETLFGYTNVGFVSVDSAGNKRNLTEGVIGDVLPGAKYIETRAIIVERNETDAEILIGLGENGNTFSDVVWTYNTVSGGWTQLAQNASISNVTAMAFMRDPVSGQPRLLFGMSPLASTNPFYSEWNGTGLLTAAFAYQPIFDGDPLNLTQFIWADYLFAPATANGKTAVPTWNGDPVGLVTIVDIQNAGYARAGVPRNYAVANTLSPGLQGLAGSVQSRFQGISVAMQTKTNVSKRR